jgi:hypothetical protein
VNSNTTFEDDHSTSRGAVSMLLELPPDGTAYNDTVNPSPYRHDPFDASNPFHPSDDLYIEDVSSAFFAAVLHLARRARSPRCAIDPVTLARHRQGRVMGLAAMGRGIGGVLRSPAGATTGEAVACTTSLRAPSIWLLPKFRLAPPRSTTA